MRTRAVLLVIIFVAFGTWVACSGGADRREAGRPSPADPSTALLADSDGYDEGLIRIEEIGAAGAEVDQGFGSEATFLARIASVASALPTATEREAALEWFRRGAALADDGDAAGAVDAFSRAGAALPIVSDWAEVLAARQYALVPDTAEVRRRVATIEGRPAEEWAWRAHHDALVQAGDTAAALRVAEGRAGASATAAERAYAWSRVGVLRAARGEGAALDALKAAMLESAGSAGGLAAARAAHDLPGLSPDDGLLVGRTLLIHGGVDRGIPLLETYADAAGTPADRRLAIRTEAGRILFDARRYDAAERNLRTAAEASPEAAFLLARSLYRQGRHEQGVDVFLEVGRRFGNSSFAADALFLLGDLAHDDGRAVEAVQRYREAIATGAHNGSATDAAVRLAGMALLRGDAPSARRDLEAYFSARPRDVVSAPALYWLGRTMLAAGERDAARALFREVLEIDPFSYYGALSAGRLGTSLAELHLAQPLAPTSEVALHTELAIFRIELLREIGLASEADLELARLREELEGDHGALVHVAEAMLHGSRPISGAILARDIQRMRGSWDERLLRIVYPFPFREFVAREAGRHGLDPFAVAGLIRQESFFNPVAVSAAGAIGLMQVMPQTGSGLARRAGVNGFQASMLRDPALNMRLGALYLADQMRRWDGRLSDVLAAYNAGPNRVARWREYPEHQDDEIYVERIPIAETRDYVKRVRLNAEIYRLLYEGDLP